MDDLQDQRDECMALEAILGSDWFMTNDRSSAEARAGVKYEKNQLIKGRLRVEVILPDGGVDCFIPLAQATGDIRHNETSDCGTTVEHTTNTVKKRSQHVGSVQHLPPIELSFTLPATYPSSDGPMFSLSCKWISEPALQVLGKRLVGLWEGQLGSPVLYAWYELLQNETGEELNLINDRQEITLRVQHRSGNGHDHDDVDDSSEPIMLRMATFVQDVATMQGLVRNVLDHDRRRRKEKFDSENWDCQICFGEKIGTECHRLSRCEHVYCKECLGGYLHVVISDGSVSNMSCPDTECKREIDPSDVRSVVSDEDFQRYERLQLQAALDGMKDITYCPRPSCNFPVIHDQDIDQDGETLGVCQKCSYVFCTLCRRTYHGVSPCKIDNLTEVLRDYEAADEQKRAELDRRYGAKKLQEARGEMASHTWMEENTKRCPECNVPIDKFDGCNKMTCYRCHCYFCWLCASVLDKGQPYKHFNPSTGGCGSTL
eukprot:Clim_evm2s212 gene=Clim_evmTU2s212